MVTATLASIQKANIAQLSALQSFISISSTTLSTIPVTMMQTKHFKVTQQFTLPIKHIPNMINLTKFESLKPSHSGDISLLSVIYIRKM